jgi:hypothetical protein
MTEIDLSVLPASPPSQQEALGIAAAADIVIGPHGAGFVNLLAAKVLRL